MRILHVITSLYTGGAEKLMVDLLPKLREYGHDVELLLFDGTPTPFRLEIERRGIRVHHLGERKNVYSPKNLSRLAKFVKNYDIIHTHNTAPQLFMALQRLSKNTTLVTTEHNTSNRRRKWKWFRLIDRWMYSRYDHVICISKKAEENLREHIGDVGTEISTINNGVVTSSFINAKASPYLESAAPGSRKIVMVAAFRWEKDQDTLIRALGKLPGEFHVFFVGQGVRMDECKALAVSEGVAERVHFLGVRQDVPQLLKAADYVVLSSHFEGLSLSSVEGMCSGHPFIASDVDGLREVVSGAGVLFPHEDADALAGEILRLEADPELYKTTAERCVSHARNYDISRMVEGYDKVYQSITHNS